jgi:hypothetical protein
VTVVGWEAPAVGWVGTRVVTSQGGLVRAGGLVGREVCYSRHAEWSCRRRVKAWHVHRACCCCCGVSSLVAWQVDLSRAVGHICICECCWLALQAHSCLLGLLLCVVLQVFKLEADLRA